MSQQTPDTPVVPVKKRRGVPFFRLLALLILAAMAWVWGDAALFLLRAPESSQPREVIIDIRPGATFDRVAWDLHKAGAVSSVWRFRLLAQYKKQIGSIQAGEFAVSTGWTPDRILRHLVSGQPRLYPLTIREGLPWWEVARRVEAAGFASASAFEEVIHDAAFLAAYAIPFANAEGFLFPDTYFLNKPKSLGGRAEAEAVVRVLVESFWKRTWPLWQEYARTYESSGGTALTLKTATLVDGQPRFSRPVERPQASGTFTAPITTTDSPAPASPPAGLALTMNAESLRRVLTLASLVEKETGVPEERDRVAGVYTNRLVHGMLLQCDPTIIYGVGPSFTGSIRKSQLADAANLYNTYQHAGLPPGPICSPGAASLRAAMFPENHRYLFFVASGVDAGHVFSTNLADHNKAVARYRQAIRNRP